MEESLSFFYTYRLRGQLNLLPRLYTYLRRLRAEQSVSGRRVTLDLGESCAPEVFPCALTGGRSTWITLDAMGYDAANVEGTLAPQDRDRLEAMNLHIALVDRLHSMTCCGALLSVTPELESADLIVDLNAGQTVQLTANRLQFSAVETGQIGLVRMEKAAERWQITQSTVFDLPDNTQPDPTIAGAVEFVLSEARYLQKRQG